MPYETRGCIAHEIYTGVSPLFFDCYYANQDSQDEGIMFQASVNRNHLLPVLADTITLTGLGQARQQVCK